MIKLTRDLLLKRPFEPFRVRTSGGREYAVPTADHAAIDPRGVQVAIWYEAGGEYGQTSLSALHIAGVDQLMPLS